MMTNDAENAAMKNGEPSETDNIKRKDVSRRAIKILYAVQDANALIHAVKSHYLMNII